MPTGDCPICGYGFIGSKPVCPRHWAMVDAATKVAFISAQSTHEKDVYRGDSLDAFSKASDAVVAYVRAQLEEQPDD